jgi:leucyl/phenylalanyl-tRNA--protein transferase
LVPVYLLDPRSDAFPPPRLADESGLLAVGGDLSPRRLLAAYSQGIFPWYSAGQPILWHSPDPRFVIEPARLHVPASLKKTVRRGTYEVRFDTAFAEVIGACGEVPRAGQNGTWITDEMRDAYVELHRLGLAHSAEAWKDGALQGGLYGVSLGSAFFGESMFARAPDASKVAFVTLVEWLRGKNFNLIDCQVYTDHLARFGAEMWPRERFLGALEKALEGQTLRGPWRLEGGST